MTRDMPKATVATDVGSLHLPRILCLHGGGTNARIFRAQCRGLFAQLKTQFRLVFAEAPFASHEPGPDVGAVYGQWGPFRRWLRYRPDQPWIPPADVARAIDYACEHAMVEDDVSNGATGEWVAVLGFSQGAKVAASLLYRQQMRRQIPKEMLSSIDSRFSWVSASSDSRRDSDSSFDSDASADSESWSGGGLKSKPYFRFGILLAGRGPLVSLEDDSATDLSYAAELVDASSLTGNPSNHLQDLQIMKESLRYNDLAVKLQIPTIHVHGRQDPGIEFHRGLYRDACDPQSRILVEWEGGHRLPFKSLDVAAVVDKVQMLARLTGIY